MPKKELSLNHEASPKRELFLPSLRLAELTDSLHTYAHPNVARARELLRYAGASRMWRSAVREGQLRPMLCLDASKVPFRAIGRSRHVLRA